MICVWVKKKVAEILLFYFSFIHLGLLILFHLPPTPKRKRETLILVKKRNNP